MFHGKRGAPRDHAAWTFAELLLLHRALALRLPMPLVAAVLGRSYPAVRAKASRTGEPRRRRPAPVHGSAAA